MEGLQTVDSQALITKELTLLCWSVLPLDCYNKGALKESWHQVEVGGSPRLMLLQLNAAFFYRIRNVNELWHEAEVGGFPQLKLLSFLFIRPSPGTVAQFV